MQIMVAAILWPPMSEWAEELGQEVEVAADHVLPLIVGRRRLRAVLESQNLSAEARLGLRLLYATGVRQEESLEFCEGGLRVREGRFLAVDEVTLARCRESGLPDLGQALAWVESCPELVQHFAACGRRARPSLLRHACAAHCLENGLDVMVLNEQLGHREMATTLRLLETARGYYRGDYERCHPLARGGRGHAHLRVEEILAMMGAPRLPLHRLVVRTLYATALRESELIALRFADLEEGRIFVRDGKGPADRYTLVDAETESLLLGLGGAPGERIFPMTRMTVYNIVVRAARATGVADHYPGQMVSPHSLRHAYATHCYENGMDLHTIARLLGHPFVSDTLLYVDCSPEMLAAEYSDSSSMNLESRGERR